jgi:CRISPR-associated endonuclease Cas1
MSAKRPGRDRRDLSVLLTCAHCGALFHPWRYHENAAYCSRSCRSQEAVKSAITAAYRATHGTSPEPPAPPPPAAAITNAGAPGAPGSDTTTADSAAISEKISIASIAPAEPAPELPSLVTSQAWYQAGERRRQLADELLTPDARVTTRHDQVLVLAGDGAALKVRQGLLLAQEGWTHGSAEGKPPSHTLWPGMHRIGHIIILSGDGYVSFEALRLAREQEIAVTLVGRRGELLASLTTEYPAASQVRQRQYAARASGEDVAISRELIRRKLEGQRRTIVRHFSDLPDPERALEALDLSLSWFALSPPPPILQTPEGIRHHEAGCARAYFLAMHGLPLTWVGQDIPHIPPHWRAVRDRVSPLSSQRDARYAVDPFNAALNYCYACLASQTRIALTALGFDTNHGLLHTDRPRLPDYPALVFDVMELARPEVDHLLLRFIRRTTFAPGDFVMERSGECRLHPQLARVVVAACRVPQSRIDEYARWLRDLLLHAA